MTSRRTLVIAEAGVNHNGSIVQARALVAAAAEAGADIVKFQTFSAERQVTRLAMKAPYQAVTTGVADSQHEMLKRLELTIEMHRELMHACEQSEIGFLSTAFDIESVHQLFELGVRLFKVPSGEITNLPYLECIGGLALPVLLSTGMSTMSEISEALRVIEAAGTSRELITVLHCTTEYPAPLNDINLLAMLTIRDAFGVRIGYSDHSLGITVPIAAVALGATVIEKHFTLDRELPGPDHRASLEPDELRQMVQAIRETETALGSDRKVPAPSESRNLFAARKSIVAAMPIRVGEPFTEQNLTTKRPGNGISPMHWHEVIGSIAKRDYESDEVIES